MFEISWSELLILAVVTLIFVGPKDLPKFLNTLGRYAGMVRRQAAEFRAQFDEAMRQAELDALKKEVNDLRAGVENTVRDAQVTKPSSTGVAPEGAEVKAVEPPPLQPKLPLGRTAEEIAASASATPDNDVAPSGSEPPSAKPDDKAGT